MAKRRRSVWVVEFKARDGWRVSSLHFDEDIARESRRDRSGYAPKGYKRRYRVVRYDASK